MAWFKPTFRQGVNALDQSISNKGAWAFANLIRFYQGAVQVIGGWLKHAAEDFDGIAYGGMSWRTKEGLKVVAWGTPAKLYAEIDGTRREITPNLHETVLIDAFSTRSGSSTVTLTLPQHRMGQGDSFTLSNHQSTIGGLTLEGDFTVVDVPTPDTLTFDAGSNASGDHDLAGGNVDFTASLPASDPIECWTMAPWGENGMFNPSGLGLFEFQPETDYNELAYNGDFGAGNDGWAEGDGWNISGGSADATSGTASNLSQSIQGVVEPGRVYAESFDVVVNDGSLKVRINTRPQSTEQSSVVTVNISSPEIAVFSSTADLADGQGVSIDTDGMLPTGIDQSITYYVFNYGVEGPTEFYLVEVPGDDTSAVVTTGSQFGTHTITKVTPDAVIDVGAASAPITKTGSYSRIFIAPADPADIVFQKDSDFEGSVSNVSYSLLDRAYRITTAPARIDAMLIDVNGLVILLGTTDSDQAQYSATLYRCSDLGNNKSYVPDTNSLATEQQLRGVGGRLMGGISTSEQNLIGGDEGVLSLQYQGLAGNAFKAVLLGSGCGWISRRCAVAVNGLVQWVSNAKKFFIFQGAGIGSLGKPIPIGCPIESDVFDHLDEADWGKVHAGLNLAFQEGWFFYHDNRDSGSECTRVAVVAWTETDQSGAVPWTTHMIGRSTWIAAGTFAKPIGFGQDSEGDSYLYDHETGQTADGDALGEYIESTPFDVGEGEFLMELKRIIPDFESTTGNIDIYVKARMSPKGSLTTYGPFTATQAKAFLDMRVKARQIALRFVGRSAGAFWRMLAIRLDLFKTGAKR
jgi:hypothetical protein